MKAIRFHEYGGPEVLRVEEVERPEPVAAQVRIAVRAAGVNPLDWRLRSGMMRDAMPLALPAGVGFDAAGIVDALGPDVAGIAIGDRVFGRGRNTAAECAVLSAWSAMPEALTFEEAAGLPTSFETAWRALHELDLARGETLLLTAAAGGVGTAVMQLARDAGVRVVATASLGKHDHLRKYGAIPLEHGPNLGHRLSDAGFYRIDAALDLVGQGTVVSLIAITGNPVKVLTLVDFDAPRHGARTSFGESPNLGTVLQEAAARWARGRFRMPVQQSFPLADVAHAQRLSEGGHVTGRLVISVP